MTERPATQERRVVQLPAALANQIAAGEVVTRPASVVKELVENAVDAAARTVQVEIESAGVKLVRVIDDGHGMSEQDATLALERYATSKIRCVQDLSAITTLGFRGEALPSIAAVSRFCLKTRRPKDDAGTEITVDGDGERRIAPCGCAPGTTVEVADLFHNIPARRKFLRALATESAQVGEVVRAAALANPGVQIGLRRDGRAVRSWLRMDRRAERVADVLKDYELAPCTGERGPISLQAYLSRPERARSGARGLHLFVNDRAVQDRALARAVASAYGETLDRGRFPVGAVFISIPPELVDVNVHPEKAVVRFAHARAVTDAVYSVLSRQLAAALDLPTSTTRTRARWGDKPRANEAPEPWQWSGSGQTAADRAATDGTAMAVCDARPSPDPGHDLSQDPPLDASQHLTEPADQAAASGPLRLVAVLQDRYLLAEHAGGIVVVARRPARAAALLTGMRRSLTRGKLPSQRLLFPLVVQVQLQLAELVQRADEALDLLGFDLRCSGPRSITTHAIPQALATGPAEQLIAAALAALGSADGALDAPQRDSLIATLARMTAAAETNAMSASEAGELLATVALPQAGSTDRSPLGSVIVSTIDYRELARREQI